MGLNGSGKSTMLKLVNGIMAPDSGTVLTRGRIAGLIATGAGFHSQLTGRENIYLNAAILGMSEAETKRKFDDIVEFADIGKHLDGQVGPLQLRTVGAAGLRDRDPRRLRHLPGRRGARRRGPTVQAQVPGADAAGPRERADAGLREPRGRVGARMCDRVIVLEPDGSGFDGPVDEGIRYVKYDDDVDDRRRQLRREFGAEI